MDLHPFFSVIIPFYNSASYIDKALFALEQQHFKDFEVILIDDCSTDNSYEYCKNRVSKSNLHTVKILKNVQNSGPGFSRNVGIQAALGKYLTFCDSDDWYEDFFFEEVYQKIHEREVDILFYDFYFNSSKNSKTVVYNTFNFKYCVTKADYIALATDSLWSIVVKRDLFSNVSIADMYNAEDVVTVPLLTAEADNISFLSKPLYNYKYRRGSLSKKNDLEVVNNFWNAFLYLEKNSKFYRESFEFHSVKLVIYGLFYNAIRCGMGSEKLEEILNEFQRKNPDWRANKYLKYLPLRKRLWIFCVCHKLFFVLRFYYKMQILYFTYR